MQLWILPVVVDRKLEEHCGALRADVDLRQSINEGAERDARI